MRRMGSIRLRAPGRFSLIFNANASLDPATGKRPRDQQYVMFEAPPGTPILSSGKPPNASSRS